MIDDHGAVAAARGATGMSSSLTSQRRGRLDNLTDALGGALCTWTMPSEVKLGFMHQSPCTLRPDDGETQDTY